jgi:hypothetical protein
LLIVKELSRHKTLGKPYKIRVFSWFWVDKKRNKVYNIIHKDKTKKGKGGTLYVLTRPL